MVALLFGELLLGRNTRYLMKSMFTSSAFLVVNGFKNILKLHLFLRKVKFFNSRRGLLFFLEVKIS